MKSLNLLWAEDHASHRRMIELMVSRLGHHVVTCPDGSEVLKRYFEKGERYDVVILDVRMPVLDGMSVAHALRAHADTKDVPIIFVTAASTREQLQEAWSADPDDILVKPFTRGSLARAIEQVLHHRGKQSERC